MTFFCVCMYTFCLYKTVNARIHNMTFAQIFAQFAVNASRFWPSYQTYLRFWADFRTHIVFICFCVRLFCWKWLESLVMSDAQFWCPVFFVTIYNTGKCLKICSNCKCCVVYSSIYQLPLAKHQGQNGPKLLKWTLFKQQRLGNITLVIRTASHTEKKYLRFPSRT